MHRRRSAGLVVIAVAALASAGTSSVVPTPAATAKASLEGSFELTPGARVGVQEFTVRLPVPADFAGQRPDVSFNATATLSTSDDEQFLLRVVATTPEGDPSQLFRSVPDQASRAARKWTLTCDKDTCSGTFALVGEWQDPEAEPTATIDWRIDATIDVWAGVPAGAQPPIPTMTADKIDVDAPHINVATAGGEPVRFDERHRSSQWRVTMTLGDEPIDPEKVSWPLITTGRLTPTKSIIESTPDGDAGDALLFVYTVGDGIRGGLNSTVADDVLEFQPSWTCEPATPCTAEYIVGLTWPDVRVGGAIDAGWNLDLRAIGVDGRDVPLSVTAELAKTPAMVTGTAKGTLVWSKGNDPDFRYLVSLPTPKEDDGSWDDLRVPAYGIWRATMRSTGSAPLPSDFAVNFGRYGGERRIRVEDGEVVNGFDPFGSGGGCSFASLVSCQLDRDLAAGFSEQNLPAGWEFTIDWELEIGIGTTDPAGGTLKIVDVTNATPQP